MKLFWQSAVCAAGFVFAPWLMFGFIGLIAGLYLAAVIFDAVQGVPDAQPQSPK